MAARKKVAKAKRGEAAVSVKLSDRTGKLTVKRVKPKEPKPLDRLMMAVGECARVRGEILWTNGYRTGKGEPESSRLYAQERGQWRAYDDALTAFRRLAMRLLREAAT
jgi:hypothetical protein